jgi:mycothiol S-conjugate amidase
VPESLSAAPGPAKLRLMAVHAHPDDESSKGAATMARYVSEGVDVLVVTCTGGERGDILNPAMDRPEIKADIGTVRQKEMAAAREILGVEQRWLGFVDSGFPEGDPPPPLPEGCFGLEPLEVAGEPLVRAIREFRPHVMLTYDENGGYPHPDRYPGTGEPWQPLKLYYHLTFHKERFEAEHRAMVAAGIESPYTDLLNSWVDKPVKWEITTKVPCADFYETRDRALLAHATQIDPQGPWFACPLDLKREAWPTEDYHLARSLVDTELPEDDLFAGIRERVCL